MPGRFLLYTAGMNCPFCEPKQRVLKENTHAYLMLSNPRRMEGHFLVIPKRHIELPWEVTKEEIVDIFELIKFVQQRLVPFLGEGTRVQQNYMPFLPDSKFKVAHTHYHVMPRNFKDKMYELVDVHDTALFEDLSVEEHTKIAKLVE